MEQYNKYVGLDVHKSTIAVAIAVAGRRSPVSWGIIENTPESLRRMMKKVCKDGEAVAFCYEAGPCGYEVYRQMVSLGYHCDVVAPSLIPRKAGDRVKTDRRDAKALARLYRSGDLTPVWVPGKEQEAMRDLMRARGDFKAMQLRARQRLNAFLLRHGRVYSRCRWTQAHHRWLERQQFDHPVQQVVFQEYVDAVVQAGGRVKDLEDQIRQTWEGWEWAPAVEALMALRGVNLMTAVTVMAELGDVSRFDTPRQLMAYLGLVPSEYTTGGKRRQGGITKTGNTHARRMLVESAWSYRFPARKTAHLQRRAEKTSEEVQAIAWKAQKRLCRQYRLFLARGKKTVQACTAVARELVGFIWAIVCEVMGKRVHAAVEA